MSKKKTTTTSLTKQALLKKLAVVDREVSVEGLGKYIVRPRRESLETRRVSAMYNADGERNEQAMELRRVLLVIDCLYDLDGNQIFSDNDISELMKSDSSLLTPLYMAVAGIVDEESEEGNGLAESSD